MKYKGTMRVVRARKWRAGGHVGGVAVLTIFVATGAGAFPSSRFVYSRAPGAEKCPDEEAMRKEVAARLGYDPFFVWAERTIVARIEREPQRLRATVQLLDGKGLVQGSRTIVSANNDCAELAKSMALVISIGIDPEFAEPDHRAPATAAHEERATESPDNPPRPSAPPPPSPGTSDDRTGEHPKSVPPGARIEPEFGAGPWTATGLAPRVSFGGSVFAGLRWGPAALYVEGRDGFKTGDEVETALLVASVVPCFRLEPIFGCAMASWGELRAEAQRSASAGYIAVGARVGFEVPVLRRLSLRSHVDVAAPLDRTIVKVNGRDAWQLPAVSGSLGVEAALHFP